ncbi:response regulator transcription factor [Frankia sp. AgB1.9]|uniref:LuxR C-terminal-related transcriptional regulator n=1 Tax=unclassified Frankia TaxID=2632575 RepID=UPI0019330987|nr:MULTISPECIES: response regulator transcription factor [unclassified Frankia]MBL7487755.1 response regulator transcription factor [Frankia sp. AgW1.1]MBL7548002.1 response regulator transcription factor [Frankia sp. AgB1.9]MBL7622727.1 response regulator transcription factor [Frankia sp. AgB1.8]
MRVVIADDAVLLREGVLRILADDRITVTGVVGDPDSLLDHVAREAPDLAIVDIRMPPTFTDEGLRAARAIRADHPGTAVLLLSQHVQVGGALDLFTAGAGGLGYLLKDRVIEIDDFLAAVRRVAAGGSVVDPVVIRALVQRRSPLGAGATLSERERDVLSLMAQGLSNGAIAARLVVSLRTVETHVASIFTKLGLLPTAEEHRRVRAVITYLNGPAGPPTD